MQACLSHTGDVFLPTVQIPLHFPFLEKSKVKHLQQIMHKVDSPQAGCGCLTLRKLDGSGPGGDQTASCGVGFALRGARVPRCPRLRPHSTAGGLYPTGAGAWEPLECWPLVVAESAVSPPLLSRCSFYVRRPGVYRPYPWAHVVAEFAVVAVLRCEAVLAA